MFRTGADDRIFGLVHEGDSLETREIEDFELVFRKSYRGYYENPNFEDPKDADKDNVYELIIRGGSRGFPHAYFPVNVEITDVLYEQPLFPDETTTRYVPENARVGHAINPAMTRETVPRDNDTLTYSIGGTDAASFEITESGYLRTKTLLDYSATPTYSVTVSVRDDEDYTGGHQHDHRRQYRGDHQCT